MNNVLLVGNGFDLAHGLLTKYEHFLDLMKNWNKFYVAFQEELQKSEKQDTQCDKNGEQVHELSIFDFWEEPENIIDKYIRNASNMDEDNINELGSIICSNNNSWIRYYCNCEAEIDGWIDFEREIYPVIELFESIFNANYTTLSHGVVNDVEYVEAIIERTQFSPRMLRTASLWKKYFGTVDSSSIKVKSPYVSRKYGILKKKIIENLRKEFEEFIYAFEIYLHEFVYKNDDVKPLKQIKEININNVISFNYTLTEKLYGIAEDDVHHLHGMIREDITQGKNNMVMGVSESSEQNMDFIYFVKYFQRIQKSSGTKYKALTRKGYKNSYGLTETVYNLYIYGHSLDETDKDIITYIIGTKEELAEDTMRTQHVTIFYYDAADYEQKVINLINLYGRDIVEAFMERKWFEFVPTSSAVIEV